jgi:hypothetical protein
MIVLSTSLNFDSSASAGGIVDDFFVSNADVPGLLAGRTYINVHTAMFEFGEIRGYLVRAVPEPGCLPVAATGLITCLTRRRRGRQVT